MQSFDERAMRFQCRHQGCVPRLGGSGSGFGIARARRKAGVFVDQFAQRAFGFGQQQFGNTAPCFEIGSGCAGQRVQSITREDG